MKLPIFLVDSGDLVMFRSVEEAESYIEVHDINVPNRFVCDASGAVLQQHATKENRVKLSPPEESPTQAERLTRELRNLFEYLHQQKTWNGSPEWVSNASLDELVEEYQRHQADWSASRGGPVKRWLELIPCFVVLIVTVAFTWTTIGQALGQYRALRTGWSWDLAYYNQWFWALTQGNGIISVRPLSPFGVEGPPVWVMNYLTPIRLLIAPIYWSFPSPITLLVVQNVIFWWAVPAAYTLVKSETRSRLAALSAALLVPLTPILWPLVWNDFRELQLAIPFVIWAVQGVRSRRPILATFGILAMMFCRQEFAVVGATFAFMPPRDPEPTDAMLRWRHGIFLSCMTWFLFGFFGYLHFFVSSSGPELYIRQFTGEKAALAETAVTASEFLLLGLGAWSIFMWFTPRVAILALPWIWQLCSGLWAMRLLEGESWHHVRYAAPATATVLAMGLVGYSRLCRWLLARPRGRIELGVCWIAAAGLLLFGDFDMSRRLSKIPRFMDQQETAAVWKAIQQVGPDEAVLAAYEVTAPLSSRRELYSYVLEPNRPRGFPVLEPSIHWVFLSNRDPQPNVFPEQGFKVVHKGPFLTIMHRE